ncbi:MAG TPA: creatininase family protein [Bryobacteraceae bacterium]|jgi:creatinine amidohydrolase|nr:creatininase family protein [Bryobacteraceae bacterium]
MTKSLAILLTITTAAFGQPPAGRGQRQDMATLPRPIDMHDTVWIEDMTQLEVRDSLKAGKTTALVFAGGMEDNGPYITVSQHNLIVHAMCDMIARKLGNALCAPIVGMSPGVPDRSKNPGSVVLSQDTFKAVASDIATSLKTEGFLNIMFMVDHGADAAPMQAAAKDLSEKWAGSGAAVYYVPEYYNYNAVEKFEHEVLGVTEKREGFHDDYYTASISVAIDPVEARMQERVAAGKTTINGVDLGIPKAAQDGRKIMAMREEAAVTAIRKLLSGMQR